ncbi:hypothetical protein BDZ91DRAFT_450367 [Kalaharituber pfeilii]|nr:hypothetical protein BDZ91DRAFT_450367 [Kalaharituber pfeilii]
MNGNSGWHSPPQAGTLSNKSSSLPSSFQLDEGGILNDLGNFEEIGLDDDNTERPKQRGLTANAIPKNGTGLASLRDLTVKRPLQNTLSTDHLGLPGGSRRSNGPLPPNGRRSRNSSPSPQSCPQSPAFSPASSPSSTSSSRRSYTAPIPERIRRSSLSRRKTTAELEKECESDGDDEIPADAIFWNVPVSPRRLSQNISASTSPDREYANGATTSRASGSPPRNGLGIDGAGDERRGQLGKTKSFNEAIVEELSPEVRELTEKLEEYAEEAMLREEKRRQQQGSNAKTRAAQRSPAPTKKIALPPIQTSNGMIDPLPISKEKEAVLSRTRPSWLPPKSKGEERRHLREYQKMMQKALQAEQKRAEKERREQEQREKLKADIHRVWEQNVIPEWDAAIQKPETRELWWRGISSRLRAEVWEKALGNHLRVSEETYRLALARAKELAKGKGTIQSTKEQEMFAAIRRDVKDTFPELKIFQERGPLHESLTDVLYAYSMYRSDVGYVYGTHVIAGILVLNQSPVKAFISLVNILNRPVPLAFYTHDEAAISKVYTLFLRAFQYKLPTLFQHIHVTLSLPPPAYLEPMFLTLFALHCPLDVTSRLWDVYVFEGDAFLVRTAIGVLTALETKLYGSKEEVIEVLGWKAEPWKLGKEDDFMATVRSAGKEEKEVESDEP